MLAHVWFSTKRRKWLLRGYVAEAVERSLRAVAQADGIRLRECQTAIDHVHLLIELDSAHELPLVMKKLKGRSARSVLLEMPAIKLDAETNNLWQRGYAWKEVPLSAEVTVRRYIRTQPDRLEKFAR